MKKGPINKVHIPPPPPPSPRLGRVTATNSQTDGFKGKTVPLPCPEPLRLRPSNSGDFVSLPVSLCLKEQWHGEG